MRCERKVQENWGKSIDHHLALKQDICTKDCKTRNKMFLRFLRRDIIIMFCELPRSLGRSILYPRLTMHSRMHLAVGCSAGFSSGGPDCSLLDPMEYHKLLFVPLLSVYLIALPSSAEDLLLERTIKRDNHRKPIIPSIAPIGHG